MKTKISLYAICVVALLSACRIGSLVQNQRLVNPSKTVISEQRPVSGFTKIDMSAFGKVIITQGDSESLTIKGSDNIVPLVKTSVSNGTLTIKMDEGIGISGVNSENILTFTIGVKDLSGLTVSGAADVSMDSLTTKDLALDMSGAGQIVLGQLTADTLNINLSGVGNIEAAGQATSAKMDISGAGSIKAADLKIQTAEITISGLGGAEVWVTDELTGDISGAGNVKYYGSPTVKTTTSGLGKFEAQGDK